jgi:hypothetical protein
MLWLAVRIRGNIGLQAAIVAPDANGQRYASRDHGGGNYKHDREQVGCHVRIPRGGACETPGGLALVPWCRFTACVARGRRAACDTIVQWMRHRENGLIGVAHCPDRGATVGGLTSHRTNLQRPLLLWTRAWRLRRLVAIRWERSESCIYFS